VVAVASVVGVDVVVGWVVDVDKRPPTWEEVEGEHAAPAIAKATTANQGATPLRTSRGYAQEGPSPPGTREIPCASCTRLSHPRCADAGDPALKADSAVFAA